MAGASPTEAQRLAKTNLSHWLFHGTREIIKRKRTLVLVQSKITHDVVGIGRQLVGEISYWIILAECNEKIDVLKYNDYLNNEFYDLKHYKIEYGVEKPDENILPR